MEKDRIDKEIIARKLALGQVLDIEIQDEAKNRFKSPLIGMKNGLYLVAELPTLTKHGNLRDQMRGEQALIIRTICEKTTGECLGFKSFVVSKVMQPDQLLFITFPKDVQIHELREEKRMLVIEKANIVFNHGERVTYGLLTDLSGGGCRFEYEAGDLETPTKGGVVEISFKHPESSKDLKSTCRICSVRSFQNMVSLGMAFTK